MVAEQLSSVLVSDPDQNLHGLGLCCWTVESTFIGTTIGEKIEVKYIQYNICILYKCHYMIN